VSGKEYFPPSFGEAQGEARLAWVSITLSLLQMIRMLTRNSFMADKVMPLSEAVEGYDIFDKMKAQKVVFEAQK
jgi:hypothetical protein